MKRQRYHVTPDGPKKCSAEIKRCKYAHYNSFEEADAAYTEQMSAQGLAFVPVTKKTAGATRQDAVKVVSLEEAASTPKGLEQIERTIETRIEATRRYWEALNNRDPQNPDANQPVKKKVYAELKKRFNSYRDQTARLVEASENSPHKKHTYVDQDLDSIGDVHSVTGYEANTKEWLQARQQTVGGSDVGALVENDFTPEEDKTYWMKLNEKRATSSKLEPVTDEVVAKSQARSHGGSGPLYRGTVWEDRIRDDFAKDHPEFTVINTKHQYSNNKRSWQQINVDGVLSRDGGKTPFGILEIKTGGNPSSWDNGVPNNYRAQTLYYLHATGLKEARVRVCLNDYETREYTLKSTDEVFPGSGVTMDKYLRTRIVPWREALERTRGAQ